MAEDQVTADEPKEAGHPLIWSITALLLLVLLAVAGHKYREQQRQTLVATAPLQQGCMLNEEQCTTALPQGPSATVTITPRPIYAATPMQMALQLNGIEAEGVEVEFRGESMNMGRNQFTLSPQADGGYGGEVILPVCVRKSMVWIAEVQVATPQGKVAFPFRFESLHP